MSHHISYQKIGKLSAVFILLFPIILYGLQTRLRPSTTEEKTELFKGILYQRKKYVTSRPFIVHAVEIDLNTSKIKPFVTPSLSISDRENTNQALTTSEFIQQFGVQLAINGSFFFPFREVTPWSYYPKTGETVNALGQSISQGLSYGKFADKWNTLCFDRFNQAQIYEQKTCPNNTVWGIAGGSVIVIDGKSDVTNDTPNYARTVVATNKEGNKLWLIIVDGKQPVYSEGATLKEVAAIAIKLGADRAINLDGGGSTTLAIAKDHEIKVLNAPIHSKILMNERPVANHLGFFAEPIE